MSDHVESIACTKEQVVTIERWKKNPILFATLSQFIYDARMSNIIPCDSYELYGEGTHQFRLFLAANLPLELIGELRYSNRDEQGLHVVGYSTDSHSGKYYRSQLETIAKFRKIPFIKAD